MPKYTIQYDFNCLVSTLTSQNGLTIMYLVIVLINFSKLVQYHQNRVDSISELERRLESSGYGVGLKMLEVISYRNREVRIV